MTPEQWQEVKVVFECITELDPLQREEYLRSQQMDEGVRLEVGRLLAHHEGAAAVDEPVVGPGRWKGLFTSSQLQTGEVLGKRFRVARLLGSGGMGDVYEAYDQQLNAPVAIKTIRAEIAQEAAIISRFRREVQLSRQVTHPNVCRAFELLELSREDGSVVRFLTMEFVAGETLAERLRRSGPMEVGEARPLIEQMVAGLAAAHAAHVIHRDFKGSNVMVTSGGRAVVTDFGLARSISLNEGTTQTASGVAAGTPAYMAPEQLEGGTIGPSADIYALGVVMYEMATGKVPHAAVSPLQVAARRVKERPMAPREVRPDVDPRWERVILRCLEYRVADRFARVEDVADALRAGRPSIVRPAAGWHFGGRARRWGIGAAIAVALAAGAYWWRPWRAGLDVATVRYYEDGVRSLESRELQRAQSAFEEVARRKPSFAAGRARLAETLAMLDQADRAREQLLGAGEPRDAQETRLVASVRGLLTREFAPALEAAKERFEKSDDAGRITAGLDWARLAESAEKPAIAIEALEQVLRLDADQPAALAALGSLTARRDSSAGLALLDRSGQTYLRLNRPEGQADVALRRARIMANQRHPVPAVLAELDHADELARRAGSVYQQWQAGSQRALQLTRDGNSEGAKRQAEKVAMEAQRTGLPVSAARGIFDLAEALLTQAQVEDARERYQSALEMANRLGARKLEADARLGLGRTHIQLLQPEQAMPMIEAAEKFYTAAGYRAEALRCDASRGAALVALARFDEAVANYEKRLRQLRLPEEELQAIRTKEQIAFVRDNQGEYPEMARLYEESASYHQRKGSTLSHWQSRLGWAAAVSQLGRYSEAKAVAEQALADPKLKNASVRHEAQRRLGIIQSELGNHTPAIAAAEANHAEAVQLRQSKLVNNARVQLCVLYAMAGRPAATQTCELARVAIGDPERSPAPANSLEQALATVSLGRGDTAGAIAHAEQARRYCAKIRNGDEAFYALLIAAQAHRRSRSVRFAEVRAQVRREFGEFERRWGKEVAKGYLSRPPLQLRWNEIMQ